MHYRGPRRRLVREWDRKLFVRNNLWKWTEERNRHPNPGSQEGFKEDASKWPAPRHIIIKLSEAKDKENFKSNKRKASRYIWGSHNKTLNRFFSRNLANQNVGWWCILNAAKLNRMQQNLMGCTKSSSKREFYSDKCVH